MEIRGDLNVGRLIEAGRRVNTGAKAETDLSVLLDKYSEQMLMLDVASTGEVRLPDATTLPLGWSMFINVSGDSEEVIIKTYHAVTPVELKEIIPGRAYEFTLINDATAAGVWLVNYLEEADLTPSERYIVTFTSSIAGDPNWGGVSGGYHSITINGTTHGRGTRPTVQVFKNDGTYLYQLFPDEIKITKTNGDVTIRVPSDPVLAFAGVVVLV